MSFPDQTNSSLCENRWHWQLPLSSYSNRFESELEGLDCSSESIASQLKEKHSVYCSDEEVDDPPQVDSNEDLSDDGQKEIPGEDISKRVDGAGFEQADLTQLHPLSPEFISRQATINIANSQVVALDVLSNPYILDPKGNAYFPVWRCTYGDYGVW